jgi:hypothetical protein
MIGDKPDFSISESGLKSQGLPVKTIVKLTLPESLEIM